MIVFKSFFKIAKRYIPILSIYVFSFLVLIGIMFKVNSASTVEEFKAQEIDICIIDHDKSDASKNLVSYLDQKHHTVKLDEDVNVFRDAIYNRIVNYVLIIPKGFGNKLENATTNNKLESYKLPGSMTADFFEMDMNAYLSTYNSYLSLGYSDKDAYEACIETLKKETKATINKKESAATSKASRFYTYFPYVIISVIITGFAPILIRFNTEPIRKRTLCSNFSLLKRNIALACGSGIYTIIITSFFILISLVLCGKDMLNASGVIHIINALTYAFVCLGLAFFISTLTTKSSALNMLANVIGLGSSFMCGIFVSRDLLSETVLKIGRFFPAYWYLNVESELTGSTFSWTPTMTQGFLVQLLFFVAFMVLAILSVQVRRNR